MSRSKVQVLAGPVYKKEYMNKRIRGKSKFIAVLDDEMFVKKNSKLSKSLRSTIKDLAPVQNVKKTLKKFDKLS